MSIKGGTYYDEENLYFRGYLSLHPQEGMKLTVNEPRSVVGGSRIMALEVVVPKTVFSTPTLSAKIEVEDAGLPEFNVDATSISDALKAVVGADVSVRVHHIGEDDDAG